jgi:hypothetical protein
MANPSSSLSTSDGIETTLPFWIRTPPKASASGSTVLAETGWKSNVAPAWAGVAVVRLAGECALRASRVETHTWRLRWSKKPASGLVG